MRYPGCPFAGVFHFPVHMVNFVSFLTLVCYKQGSLFIYDSVNLFNSFLPIDAENITFKDVELVETSLNKLREKESGSLSASTVPESQGAFEVFCFVVFAFSLRAYFIKLIYSLLPSEGISSFLAKHKGLLSIDNPPQNELKCNKDTGQKQKCLQKWSRGLMHFVRGSGFINSFHPLFV